VTLRAAALRRIGDVRLRRAASGRALAPELAAAYAHCWQVTRRSDSSFASAFWMLSGAKRRALHAIYAFCRLADDIADDPALRGDRSLLLARWRAELEAAYLEKSSHPVGIALADTVQRFRLPQSVFLELLDGVESDLRGDVFETFEDLRRYCHRVASTVGLLLVRVFGYRNPRSLAYAEQLGIAVQLTNVLRDVGEDAAAGRVYFPRQDLAYFGVPAEALGERRMTDELRLLLACYAELARVHYDRAARLLPPEDRRTLRPARAMGAIYRALLDELQRRDWPCLERSLRLSKSRRVAIATAAWMGIGGR
jgi:phytoene synthase